MFKNILFTINACACLSVATNIEKHAYTLFYLLARDIHTQFKLVKIWWTSTDDGAHSDSAISWSSRLRWWKIEWKWKKKTENGVKTLAMWWYKLKTVGRIRKDRHTHESAQWFCFLSFVAMVYSLIFGCVQFFIELHWLRLWSKLRHVLYARIQVRACVCVRVHTEHQCSHTLCPVHILSQVLCDAEFSIIFLCVFDCLSESRWIFPQTPWKRAISLLENSIVCWHLDKNRNAT